MSSVEVLKMREKNPEIAKITRFILESGSISMVHFISNSLDLNLRETDEKKESIGKNSEILVVLNKDKVLTELDLLKFYKKIEFESLKLFSYYDVKNVFKKIVRKIEIHIDFIRRFISNHY